VAADDTAASVRRVVERGDTAVAAIAGRRAAEIYGGVVLQEHLEDHREDYTRFVLLAAGSAPAGEGDKLSLAVRLTNRPGAIHGALEPFARRAIDLLSVESRPFKGRPWQYHFFLDLQAPEDEDALTQALDELRERAEEVRVLGRYHASHAFVS
jgi:prephenate dehydratase